MNDWLLSVPIDDLMELKQLIPEFHKVQNENAQLRRELEALRRIQSETLQLVGDLRRQVNKQR